MKRILISNVMMIKERDRFDALLRAEGFEPVWAQVDQHLDEADCLRFAGQIDGWLAGDDVITRRVLEEFAPRLRVISKWGTGIDSIDQLAAKHIGIPICNSPGAFADAVAEVAIGYMLMLARNLGATDRAVRRGEWPKPQSRELTGQVLGLIGFGAIGRGIARRASAFGMPVQFFDPMHSGPSTSDYGWAESVPLDTIRTNSDVICLACSLNDNNRHIVDKSFISGMRQSSFLINISRGPLIEQAALCDALAGNAIAGAALDVYDVEPLPFSDALRTMDNVVLGSHNANNGYKAVEHVHSNTLRNLYRYFG